MDSVIPVCDDNFNEKKRSERRKHCALAVYAPEPKKIHPAANPRARGHGTAKI